MPLNKNKENKTHKIRRVLFIDDEMITLQTGQLMLENLGYKVVIAEGGLRGLELLKENNFDLILLDLMMPDMHGLDVLKKIRANKHLKNIPVLLQTGLKNDDDITEAYKLGILGVIPKPYNKKILKDILEKTSSTLSCLSVRSQESQEEI